MSFDIYFQPATPPPASGLPKYDRAPKIPQEPTAQEADANSQADAAPAKYARPATAPNGAFWPNRSGYIKGYPKLGMGGRSVVTIDNSERNDDLFVKLVRITKEKTFPVRQVFILAGSAFTLNNVSPGQYDIRYMDLYDGYLSRSESFDLEETKTRSGTRFSNVTLTTYGVKGGNMQSYSLSPSEF
jgi:hypothetical protein